MNPSDEQQVGELERAIMERAEHLANEYRAKAQHRRDDILRGTSERLRLAEQRETLSAKAEAERSMRRQIQATELRLRGQIDQVRWELVRMVEHRLKERMTQFRNHRAHYREWLVELLREAAAALPDDMLDAEVDAADLEWLPAIWGELVAEAAPGREIHLAEQPTTGTGGVRLRSADNRAQVDNRFEGRMARLEVLIQRTILQALFAGESRMHAAE